MIFDQSFLDQLASLRNQAKFYDEGHFDTPTEEIAARCDRYINTLLDRFIEMYKRGESNVLLYDKLISIVIQLAREEDTEERESIGDWLTRIEQVFQGAGVCFESLREWK